MAIDFQTGANLAGDMTISMSGSAAIRVKSPAYVSYFFNDGTDDQFEHYYDPTLDLFGLYDYTRDRDVWAVDTGNVTFQAPTMFNKDVINGLALSVYKPVELYSNYTATDYTAFTNTYQGIASTIYYGGNATPAAAMGTTHTATFQTFITGSGSQSNEHAAVFAVLRYDTSTTPGRAWLMDLNLHGAIAGQQGLLNGVTIFTNNYYNGSPSAAASGALWIVTKQGSGGARSAAHEAASTYPMDVGIGIVGVSSAGTTRGFTTALQIGGTGSGWSVASSLFRYGVDARDYDTYGLYLHNRSSTAAAIYVASDGGPVGFGVTPPSDVSRLVVENLTQSSGKLVSFSLTQTTPNAGDTSDSALQIRYALSASSATNELVARALNFSFTNTLTGGGVLSNARVFNMSCSTSSSTTTTNLDMIYLEQGTTSGTVTNGRGLRITAMQGTSQAGIVVQPLGGTNHSHILLASGGTIPSGSYGIYASITDDNYLAGKLGLNITAPAVRLHTVETTTTTNAALEVARLEARVSTASTGSSAGFGPQVTLYGESATDTNYRQMADLTATWATATDASRKARVVLNAWDTAAREALRVEASGSAAMIGFLGASAVARPAAYTQTYSTADRTLGAYTSDPESGAYTGIDNAQVGTVYAQLTDLNSLRTAYENLRVFAEDLAQLVNALLDDAQAYGLAA